MNVIGSVPGGYSPYPSYSKGGAKELGSADETVEAERTPGQIERAVRQELTGIFFRVNPRFPNVRGPRTSTTERLMRDIGAGRRGAIRINLSLEGGEIRVNVSSEGDITPDMLRGVRLSVGDIVERNQADLVRCLESMPDEARSISVGPIGIQGQSQ